MASQPRKIPTYVVQSSLSGWEVLTKNGAMAVPANGDLLTVLLAARRFAARHELSMVVVRYSNGSRLNYVESKYGCTP